LGRFGGFAGQVTVFRAMEGQLAEGRWTRRFARHLVILVVVASAPFLFGCSTNPAGNSYTDGYNYGNSYWPSAKHNGLSDAQECAALSSNARSGGDIDQWEVGCVAAGKALVSNSNDTGGT
jgi:hypothetical protein